jgi:hypothetical protein
MDAGRWIAAALFSLLSLFSLLGSAPAAAGVPAAGDVVEGAIELGLLKKIPLPQGRWRVVDRHDEETRLTGSWKPSQTIHHLVLVNTQQPSDISALLLEFSAFAQVNWSGQPCDSAAQRPNVLVVNAFETGANSVVVRCNQLHTFPNLRTTVHRATGSKNVWVAQHLGPLAGQAGLFAVNGLVQQGYLSRLNGDRIGYIAYLDPTQQGLDDGAEALPQFKRAVGDRQGPAGRYLAALTTWADAYTAQLERYFLSGSGFGKPEAMALLLPRSEGRTAAVASGNPPATRPASAAPAAPSTAPTPAPAAPTGPTAAVSAARPASNAKAAVPATAGLKAHALVIGNSAYPGAPLTNPRNDAAAISQRLRAYGLQVRLLQDASRRQLVAALAEFATQAQDADVVVLFYAGHGMQVNGVNYLIPTDLDLASGRPINVALEAVSLNTLLEDHLPGRTKIVFLDACRDNPLARSLAGSRGSSRGLAAVNAATGTLISFATRDGSTAADGAGRNSPYTTALLEHLDEAEDIALVLRRVRQKVMASTRGVQEPWEYGSLIGDKLVLSQLARRP